MTNEKQKIVIEAGHHYEALGPTVASVTGWGIAHNGLSVPFHQQGVAVQSMLFIDDVHYGGAIHPAELAAPKVEGWQPTPAPHHIVMESAMMGAAANLVGMLADAKYFPSKKKRAEKREKDGKWYMGPVALTDPKGTPLCVMLDLALTQHKAGLGATTAINVLPEGYQGEQEHLAYLAKKTQGHDWGIPGDFTLQAALFSPDGAYKVHTLLSPVEV